MTWREITKTLGSALGLMVGIPVAGCVTEGWVAEARGALEAFRQYARSLLATTRESWDPSFSGSNPVTTGDSGDNPHQ